MKTLFNVKTIPAGSITKDKLDENIIDVLDNIEDNSSKIDSLQNELTVNNSSINQQFGELNNNLNNLSEDLSETAADLKEVKEKLAATKNYQSITHDDLLAKALAGELTPGKKYRITDYECMTIQPGTQSAGWRFDIIVEAANEWILHEEASCCCNDNDIQNSVDHFAKYDPYSKIATWKVWYAINARPIVQYDNQINKVYSWVPEINKGVIYRMIDEHGIDCPYDFKNIMFLDEETQEYCYTFDLKNNNPSIETGYRKHLDMSTLHVIGPMRQHELSRDVIRDIYIGPCSVKNGSPRMQTFKLPHNIFKMINDGAWDTDDIETGQYYNIKLSENCTNNIFDGAQGRVTYPYSNIKLGNGCKNNKFYGSFSNIKLSGRCSNNTFGATTNPGGAPLIDGNVREISFKTGCQNNKIGGYCSDINFDNYVKNIDLSGSENNRINIGARCENIKFAKNETGEPCWHFEDITITQSHKNFILYNETIENSSNKVKNLLINVSPSGKTDLKINLPVNAKNQYIVEYDNNKNSVVTYCLLDKVLEIDNIKNNIASEEDIATLFN